MHQNRPLAVSGSAGRVVMVSTEGPFGAQLSSDSVLRTDIDPAVERRSPSAAHRLEALLGSSGSREGGIATITAPVW